MTIAQKRRRNADYQAAYRRRRDAHYKALEVIVKKLDDRLLDLQAELQQANLKNQQLQEALLNNMPYMRPELFGLGSYISEN